MADGRKGKEKKEWREITVGLDLLETGLGVGMGEWIFF